MAAIDGIEVFRSGIHGYGGRTTRTFLKGETVCFGDGVQYREDDEFDDTYSLILDEGEDSDVNLFYDLVDQTRWFNHSCDPNTEVMAVYDRETRTTRAWWVALRDIAVGEEITYDYAFVADVAEVCHCGAATCRGLIVDPEEVGKVSAELKKHLRLAS